MPRNGTKNLKPMNTLTVEEQKKIARAGGKRSGEVRRARKTLREELLAILSDGDTQKKISVALVKEATDGNNAGSVTKAFEVIRDTIGEKPVDKVMIAEVDQNIIDEVEAMINDEEE